MILNYSMSGSLTVPDGTVISENGQEFIPPCGKVMKLWEAVEDHNAGEDLNETELNELGVYSNLVFEREMELSDD